MLKTDDASECCGMVACLVEIRKTYFKASGLQKPGGWPAYRWTHGQVWPKLPTSMHGRWGLTLSDLTLRLVNGPACKSLADTDEAQVPYSHARLGKTRLHRARTNIAQP